MLLSSIMLHDVRNLKLRSLLTSEIFPSNKIVYNDNNNNIDTMK